MRISDWSSDVCSSDLQEAKVRDSGMADLFRRIEIVSEKDPATYARLLEEFDIEAAQFLMIGNSLRSDIAPVLSLGGWGVHMPYPTTWSTENEASVDAGSERMRSVGSPGELPAAVEAIAAAAAAGSDGRIGGAFTAAARWWRPDAREQADGIDATLDCRRGWRRGAGARRMHRDRADAGPRRTGAAVFQSRGQRKRKPRRAWRPGSRESRCLRPADSFPRGSAGSPRRRARRGPRAGRG